MTTNATTITSYYCYLFYYYHNRSTGKPKGVMVEHVSVMNVLHYFAHEMGLNCHDVVLGLTTFSFDISVLEMFMPLVIGARLVVVSSTIQKDPTLLSHLLDDDDNSITVMQATPATYEMLMAVGWQGEGSSSKRRERRIQALCGGEAFRMNLLPLALNGFKSFRNVYGPTEATIWPTSYLLHHPRPDDNIITSSSSSSSSSLSSLPLGDAIWNTQLYLLMEQQQGETTTTTATTTTTTIIKPINDPSVVNHEGELCIGGIGLARGYLHHPDLTQDKFITIPPMMVEGEHDNGSSNVRLLRLYRTGDVVMYDDKGYLKYMGRIDHQVKINGYRIELGEIEKVLQQMDQYVVTAVVVARNDCGGTSTTATTSGSKALVAYIKLKREEEEGKKKRVVVKELKSYLHQCLPAYMVPPYFVFVEDFTYTPNHKIDRKALPPPPITTITTDDDGDR